MPVFRKKGLFFALVFLAFTEFVQIAGGDDAGGQGNDRNAQDGGKHADDTSDVRGGADVAVADGGQRSGSPVKSVKKVLEHDRLLQIEHDKRRHNDIRQGNQEDREQDLPFLVEHLQEDLHVPGVPQELEDPENLQQAAQAEELEHAVEECEGRQDGQQVNDGKGREGVEEKRLPGLAVRVLVIRCEPAQKVVDDEDADRHRLEHIKHFRLLTESHRHQTEEDAEKHRPVVDSADEGGLSCFYDFKYPASEVHKVRTCCRLRN